MKRFLRVAALTLLFGIVACHSEPETIVVGEDHCGHCRMEIADARFGGELITPKGRVIKFDALSCMAGYLKENPGGAERAFVLDYLKPGTLVPVEKAYFLRARGLKAPMGEAIIASSDESGLRKLQATLKGDWLDWKSVSSSQ